MASTIDINQALALHQQGNYEQAEALYRQMLSADPHHFHANQLLGALCHQLGRNDEALPLLNTALASNPNHVAALGNKGLVLDKLNRLAEAEACFRRGLKLQADHAGTHYNLANLLAKKGEDTAAIDHFRQTLTLSPDHSDAHSCLAAILMRAGENNAAENHLQHALRLNKNNAQAHNNLSMILRERGEQRLAMMHAKQAIELKPDMEPAYTNLATIMHELGYLAEARQFASTATEIAPGSSIAHQTLGSICLDDDDLDAALASMRRALELEPDIAQVHDNIGTAFMYMGQPEDALGYFRQAVQLDPTYAQAYRHICSTRQDMSHDQEIMGFQDRFNDDDLSDSKRAQIGYGLGDAFEKLAEYETAFDYLRQANELHRSSYDYDIRSSIAHFDQLKTVFDAEYFRQHLAAGIENVSPIFIVGMPRSGTSLTEQILASHSRVYGAGELVFMNNLCKSLQSSSGNQFPLSASAASEEQLLELGSKYLEMSRRKATDDEVVSDKMPHNLFYLGIIAAVFPNAKIIHCRRNAMDTCLSIYKRYFPRGQEYANNQEELGEFYRHYCDCMNHWRTTLPLAIYDCDYESLVEQPDRGVERLLNFCDLPFESACLDFHTSTRIVRTASTAQVRSKMYTSSVGNWRKYEKQLQPLRDVLYRDDLLPALAEGSA